nr:hypothetical protein [Tanacetum cinerariifolium]
VKWVRVLDMQVTLHDKRIAMQVTLHYEAIVMQVTLHDKRIAMQVTLHYDEIVMQVTLHDKRIVMQVTLHYEAIVMQVTLLLYGGFLESETYLCNDVKSRFRKYALVSIAGYGIWHFVGKWLLGAGDLGVATPRALGYAVVTVYEKVQEQEDLIDTISGQLTKLKNTAKIQQTTISELEEYFYKKDYENEHLKSKVVDFTTVQNL